MLLLMGAILLGAVVIGTAALVGHPLYLIAAGALVAAAVLLAARYRSTPARRRP